MKRIVQKYLSKDPASFWERLSAVATLVQAIVVVISLILIKCQLQQQTDLAKAANIQELAAAAIPLNMEEVKSPELMRLTLEGQQQFKPEAQPTAEQIKKQQYRVFLSTWLIFSENIYYQNERGLIDPDMYVAWDNGLKDFLKQYDVKSSWDESMKNSYHKSFREHVDKLLAQIPAKNDNAQQR